MELWDTSSPLGRPLALSGPNPRNKKRGGIPANLHPARVHLNQQMKAIQQALGDGENQGTGAPCTEPLIRSQGAFCAFYEMLQNLLSQQAHRNNAQKIGNDRKNAEQNRRVRLF